MKIKREMTRAPTCHLEVKTRNDCVKNTACPSVCLSVCGVLLGSYVKCVTCNQEAISSSRNISSGFFEGVTMGKTLQSSPSLVLVNPRKHMNI